MTLKAVHKSQSFEKICEAGFVDILRQMLFALQKAFLWPQRDSSYSVHGGLGRIWWESARSWRTYQVERSRAQSSSMSLDFMVGRVPFLGQITVFIDGHDGGPQNGMC